MAQCLPIAVLIIQLNWSLQLIWWLPSTKIDIDSLFGSVKLFIFFPTHITISQVENMRNCPRISFIPPILAIYHLLSSHEFVTTAVLPSGKRVVPPVI